MFQTYKDTSTGDILTLPEILDKYIQINGTYKGFEEYVDDNFMNGNEQEYEPVRYVKQYSIDIELDGEELDENELINMIDLKKGCFVIGAAWQATWTMDDYEHGRPPISSN